MVEVARGRIAFYGSTPGYWTAIGAHAEIAGAIERRFGGLVDSISCAGNALVPPETLAAIKCIPARFEGFRTAW